MPQNEYKQIYTGPSHVHGTYDDWKHSKISIQCYKQMYKYTLMRSSEPLKASDREKIYYVVQHHSMLCLYSVQWNDKLMSKRGHVLDAQASEDLLW